MADCALTLLPEVRSFTRPLAVKRRMRCCARHEGVTLRSAADGASQRRHRTVRSVETKVALGNEDEHSKAWIESTLAAAAALSNSSEPGGGDSVREETLSKVLRIVGSSALCSLLSRTIETRCSRCSARERRVRPGEVGQGQDRTRCATLSGLTNRNVPSGLANR